MVMNPSHEKYGPPSPLIVWIAMTSVYIVWGSTYLAIRYAVQTIPPFFMAGTRFLIAGSFLYLVRRACGDSQPSLKEWRSAAVIGVFLLVGGNGGVVWAEQWVASGVTALLVATAPLWMILIDMLHPASRRPVVWAILGVGLGFIGVVLLIDPFQSVNPTEAIDLSGAIVLVIASLLWSIGSLYSRQAHLPSSPILGTGMEMMAGGGGLLLLGILSGEWAQLSLASISKESFLGWVYLVVFGSWIGFTAYTWLLRSAPTPLVSTYAYVNPIVAVLLGYIVAGEPLTLRLLFAMLMVVGSVAFTTLTQRKTIQSKRRHYQPNPMGRDLID
jgi:drug/metabolite transporter (DMT)-like permease